jgi:uncharacterized protein YjbI with pentapeptide repeats
MSAAPGPRLIDEATRRQLDASRNGVAKVTFSFEDLSGLDLAEAVMIDGHLHQTVLTGSRLVNARLMCGQKAMPKTFGCKK